VVGWTKANITLKVYISIVTFTFQQKESFGYLSMYSARLGDFQRQGMLIFYFFIIFSTETGKSQVLHNCLIG
jgi:hypothetical protein